MANYWYQFAPFVRRNDGRGYYWGCPDGAIAGLDFGVLSEMSSIANAERPMGLFWSGAPISGATLLAQGDCRELKSTAAMQDKWEAELAFRPAGDNLVDLIADQFMRGADPAGNTACRPLMPGVEGRLELHLAGHSRVWWRPFDLNHSHAGKVLQVARDDFMVVFEDAMAGRLNTRHGKGDREHHRRVLDALCQKYQTNDWQQFVPRNLRKEIPGRLKHETTITETFNQADSTTLGPNLTWTEVNNSWDTLSNECRYLTSGGATNGYIRAESDLSTVDQYSQISVVSIGSGVNTVGGGPTARFASSASTFYYAFVFQQDDKLYVGKHVAGIDTAFTSQSITLAIPEIYRLNVSGSSLEAFQAGVSRVTHSDSSISGNTRCGVLSYQIPVTPRFDNFEAGDLAYSLKIRSQKLSRFSLVG